MTQIQVFLTPEVELLTTSVYCYINGPISQLQPTCFLSSALHPHFSISSPIPSGPSKICFLSEDLPDCFRKYDAPSISTYGMPLALSCLWLCYYVRLLLFTEVAVWRFCKTQVKSVLRLRQQGLAAPNPMMQPIPAESCPEYPSEFPRNHPLGLSLVWGIVKCGQQEVQLNRTKPCSNQEPLTSLSHLGLLMQKEGWGAEVS